MTDAFAVDIQIDGQLQKRSLDALLAELAERQKGVVARWQLARLGFGRGAIDARVRRGWLRPIHRGVYAVGHRALTSQGWAMAAVLAGGEGAVLSHRSAAWLWGLRRHGGAHELTLPSPRRPRANLLFHCSQLPADEITAHDGIPVTIVPRTLLDLAAVVPRHQLERAIAEADHRRLGHRLSMADMLARHPRRPGAEMLGAIIATQSAARGITRQELEARFQAFLHERGLPLPRINVWLNVAGDDWVEADCVWHEQRLIAELDGREHHGTAAAFEADRARDRRLAAAGWRVIRITWRQLHDDPEAIARDLRALLGLSSRAAPPW